MSRTFLDTEYIRLELIDISDKIIIIIELIAPHSILNVPAEDLEAALQLRRLRLDPKRSVTRDILGLTRWADK
jgi:hypothetical protein